MTVEVERTFEVDAPIEEVWELLSDPEYRAQAVSVAQSYEVQGDVTVWNIAIPVPLVRGTVAVRTRDVEVDPPRYVKFVGQSKVMTVTGDLASRMLFPAPMCSIPSSSKTSIVSTSASSPQSNVWFEANPTMSNPAASYAFAYLGSYRL